MVYGVQYIQLPGSVLCYVKVTGTEIKVCERNEIPDDAKKSFVERGILEACNTATVQI